MLQNAPLLTKAEAARMLLVSERTLERWNKSGILRPVYFGRRSVRYRRDDIEAFIARGAA